MRLQTADDYTARISRALALIESRACGEEPPTLAEMAEAAALSPFHFHRIFRLMTGETVGALCKRLRLARSLAALGDTAFTITEASAGSGYATSQAFARALRQTTGLSAMESRTSPDSAAAMSDRLMQSPSKETPLAVEVVSLDPFRVMALRRQGAYDDLDSAYGALFDTVFTAVNMEELVNIWGVPLDDPFSHDAAQLSFDCAVDIGDAAPDLAMLAEKGIQPIILGGYAALHLRHVGSHDAVHAKMDDLYRIVLESQGIELTASPPLIRYLDQPEEKPESELRSDLYLPVMLEL
ncbi:helix-turn-helix domain-containing protein [Altererythrobacter indicus]|uniref:Helix-turn-helix domain-containing protein n=1 Tax=Altericroceibacterium indicum TaxID=374177 RepID=A0A845A939_9SPHN|nr:AraC family transcriptional regulator [Altericroceibacterium indicum]MXP26892.1 helix-turn-helix domain-containing protein [Altericroceibacterium indicum]